MPVHPTAVVSSGAQIDPTADIGPYCIVGDEVHIGPATRLVAHLYVEGPAWIGAGNILYPFSSIGVASQDLKYQGERAETRLGDRNKIREFVTIHRGTRGGGALTSIGNDNLLMAYSHVAHDCQIGSHCILGHAATLGGHVLIEDYAVVGSGSGVHQFCRIGRHAYIAGYSVITRDVLPYSLTGAEREARLFGENKVGLERRGFSAEAAQRLHKAFRVIRNPKLNTTQALEKIGAEVEACEEVADLVRFIQSSERGIIK
jgi:UDP-N-acetylglucosamine acyltransferase